MPTPTDKNLLEIFKKILSDPRVYDVVSTVFREIIANTGMESDTSATDNAPVATTTQRNKSPKSENAHPRRTRSATQNWEHSSDKSLRNAYGRRKSQHRPIESELGAELARRFPTYNPETQTFSGNGSGKIRTAKPDWTTMSDNSLKLAFRRRKSTGKTIEPGLHDELTRRFPEYNPEKQTLSRKSPVRKIKTDWSKSSDESLRNAHRQRKNKNLPIEDELNAVLAARFPCYDSQSRRFMGRKRKDTTAQQQPAPVAPRKPDFGSKSDATLRQLHYYRRKNNQPIEPELNDELAARFSGYDPVRQIFTRKTKQNPAATAPITTDVAPAAKTKPIRKIDWSSKSDKILYQAYRHRKPTRVGIDDILNAELALRFPNDYDAQTRTFKHQPKKLSNFAPTAHPVGPTTNATAPDKKSDDIVTTSATPKTQIEKFETKIKHTTTQPTTAPSDTKSSAPMEPAVPSEPIIVPVKVKLVKMSLTDSYNDVYINGKRVLHNHINTSVHIWGDGTILGLHGIVTDNSHLPQSPLWLVYNTDGTQRTWSGRDFFSGYDVYVKKIQEFPKDNQVRLELTNRSMILLEFDKMKRLAKNKRFELIK